MTVTTVGIVGSGAMGSGIAQTALAAGLQVILFDVNGAALSKAKEGIVARLQRLVEKGQLPPGFATEAQSRLKLAAALVDLAPADCVIEAIVERLEAKQSLFRELEGVVGPDAVLATNTSSLSVAAIASAVQRKARVCGLHFFNPVPLMQLVEVIYAPATSEEVLNRAYQLAVQLGKTAVKVKDGPGFLVNLAGRAFVTEALHIVQEGVAEVATVDRIMREAVGFRMGPFELMDLTGIDVNFLATQFIYQGYQHDPRVKTTTLHELMFNSGRYGRKTGQGYYLYGPDGAILPVKSQLPGVDATECRVRLPEPTAELQDFARDHGLVVDSTAPLALVAPWGEDAATVAARLDIMPANLVAVDLSTLERKLVTLMAPLGAGATHLTAIAGWLHGRGLRVETIKDSPGFVAQRILAMIANLGCEMAQMGIGTPEDIDLAVRLALNYPRGPLEFAAWMGTSRVHNILTNIQAVTGSDRYRPSLWLRRRALLARPIHERD